MSSRFSEKIEKAHGELLKGELEILQINMGRLCNLTCSHCHVEAGPSKTRENMNRETVADVIRFMSTCRISTLDITGGAPEMNPWFRELVTAARSRGLHVMDRCNLTVFEEPGFDRLPDFLASHEVEIVASLPCYSSENVDKQRGQGTFQSSIRALKRLNAFGYGAKGSPLKLNLVYNPVGPHLPPPQEGLARDYKRRLYDDFGIVFHELYAITNMPITRYAAYLKALDNYEEYVELLLESFNPATVEGLMCRNTLSVGWDGRLYDCDFNLALGMDRSFGGGTHIRDFEAGLFFGQPIATAEHCFGCTAGVGSSCQGRLAHAP